MKRNRSTYQELRTNNHYITLLRRFFLIKNYISDCFYSIIVITIGALLIPAMIDYLRYGKHGPMPLSHVTMMFLLSTPLGIALLIIATLIMAFIWLKSDVKQELSETVVNAKRIMESNDARVINNNVKELEFQDIMSEMAVANNIPKPKAYIINSNKYNALCTSDLRKKHGRFIGNSYIAITSGVLNDFNREQIECIVSDEIARIISGDVFADLIVTNLLISMHQYYLDLKAQLMFDYFMLDTDADGYPSVVNNDDSDDNTNNRSFLLGWLAFILGWLIHIPELFMLCIFIKKFSNNRDYNADTGSLQINNDATGLIQALKLCNQSPDVNSFDIYADDLYFLSEHVDVSEQELNHYNGDDPHHLYVGMDKYILKAFNTHTTVNQRIQHIKDVVEH